MDLTPMMAPPQFYMMPSGSQCRSFLAEQSHIVSRMDRGKVEHVEDSPLHVGLTAIKQPVASGHQ